MRVFTTGKLGESTVGAKTVLLGNRSRSRSTISRSDLQLSVSVASGSGLGRDATGGDFDLTQHI